MAKGEQEGRKAGRKESGYENLRRHRLYSFVVVMDSGSLLPSCAYARTKAWLPKRLTRMCQAHGWEIVGPGSMTTTHCKPMGDRRRKKI